MSSQATSTDTLNAISSRELADGPLQPDSQDGQTIDLFGLEVSPASPTASRAKGSARRTNATFVRTSIASFLPVDLLSTWESKLRQRLERIGSTECTLTWKASATPAGRSLSRLVPSMRRTAETDFGLWPTPTAADHARGFTIRPHDKGIPLPQRVALVLELWPTPTAMNDSGGAALCKWGGTASREKLRDAVGSKVLNGALNPEWVSWLMGFPPEWEDCAPTAMPSSRRSRRKSSAPT